MAGHQDPTERGVVPQRKRDQFRSKLEDRLGEEGRVESEGEGGECWCVVL